LTDYQQHVVDEQIALMDKLGRLDSFLVGSVFPTLHDEDQTLLREQRTHMAAYSAVLQQRIDRF